MLLENSLWDMQPAWRLQQSPLHLPKDLCFGSCRYCLCCTTWKLGAPSSQTLLAKREVKTEMEKGLLYFQRSCRVRKKKYYVENWGGLRESKAGCCVWRASLGNWLHLTNEYRKRLKKHNSIMLFGTENATKMPKKKEKRFQFQWDWNQRQDTNQLPSPCRFLQRF